MNKATAILQHRGCRWILGGWTLFIAENLILSENKRYLVESIGETSYRNVYSILSTASMASVGYGYLRHGLRKGPYGMVWKGRGISTPVSFCLQLLGFIGISQTGVYRKNVSDGEPKGIYRITRHPQLFSLGFLGVGMALGSFYWTTRIVSGFPMIVAVVGGMHQDMRIGMDEGDWVANTSLLPFAAVLDGRQSLVDVGSELDWGRSLCGVAGGVAVWVACRRLIRPPFPWRV